MDYLKRKKKKKKNTRFIKPPEPLGQKAVDGCSQLVEPACLLEDFPQPAGDGTEHDLQRPGILALASRC